MKKGARGVSLVEVLVAVMIISFVSVGILQTFLVNLNAAELNRGNTVAMAHLGNMLEKIRCAAFDDLTTRFPNQDVDGPTGNNYADIVGGYTLPNEHITVTYTDPSTDPLEIIITLTWRYRNTLDRTNALATKRTR